MEKYQPTPLFIVRTAKKQHASEEALNRRFHLVSQMPPVPFHAPII